MAATDVEETKASTYVGFDSITRQIEHKLLKRGFQFNVMVVGMYHPLASFPFLIDIHLSLGQTGLGKSTMINTIFASHLIDSKGRFEADEPVRQTTEIHPVSHGRHFSLSLFFVLILTHATVITENGVRLRLNIVDTPGFGDLVNNENWHAFLSLFKFVDLLIILQLGPDN